MRSTWRLLVAAVVCAPAAAQQPQNPSPMVEYTREHRRLTEHAEPGRREKLSLGTLFIPARLMRARTAPVVFFFHGGAWLPEVAAAENRMAVVSVQAGAGSGSYARLFQNSDRFSLLLKEAQTQSGLRFSRVLLGGWSAGCGAIRQILLSAESYVRADAVLAIDGIHADYANRKPGPLDSKLDGQDLEVWLRLSRDAVAGRKRLIITHSEIFPGTYASTTETADYLLSELHLKRRPTLKWGAMGMQQLSETLAGKFLVLGYAGNSAPDHVDQLHALPALLKLLK